MGLSRNRSAGRMSFRLGIAALVAASAALPAAAQSPPPILSSNDLGPLWNGFYVGPAFRARGLAHTVRTGGLATTVETGGAVAATFNTGGSGVLGSIYGGVDYQIVPRALVGVLAEAT